LQLWKLTNCSYFYKGDKSSIMHLHRNTTKLLKEKLIVEVASTDRKKCYELTPLGKEVLELEYNRLQRSVRNGNSILGE
ncbi:hypothetical protein ACT453_07400, partial [Bacillus sp. D-CC]